MANSASYASVVEALYVAYLEARKSQPAIWRLLLLPLRMIHFVFQVVGVVFDFLEMSLLMVVLFCIMVLLIGWSIFLLWNALPFIAGFFMSLFR